jgi:hypothetical protein
MSTFQMGDFTGAADNVLPPKNAIPTPTPNIPVQVPPHLEMADLEDALKYITSDKQPEKRAAASFLEKAPADDKNHDKIFAVARTLVTDESYRGTAVILFQNWATRADLPALREVFAAMVQQGLPGNTGPSSGHAGSIIDLLAKFGDKDSAVAIAQCLKYAPVRQKAADALTAMGADSAASIEPYVVDDDTATAKAAIGVLAKVGTEKNIIAFYRAIYLKPQETSSAAEAGLKELAARLSLKPEQYQFLLLDHYTLEPPSGFKLDPKVNTPNTRSWTHTKVNRSVVSTMTMAVKLVPQNYQITPAPEDNVVTVGTITFHRVENRMIDNQKNAEREHLQAVDGEYLIDLVIVLDQTDLSAAPALLAAANSIKPK